MAEIALQSITVDGTEFHAKLEACSTVYDLLGFLRQVTAEFGFEASCLVRVPTPNDRRLKDILLLSTMPAEFLAGHEERELYKVCPLVPAISGADVPFDYEDREFGLEWAGVHTSFAAQLYRRFHYNYYFVVPLGNALGRAGAMVFLGDRPALSDLERAKLGFIGGFLKARHTRLTQSEKLPVRLTERELQCLSLTAEGKTTVEIAMILELSPHTVNHYINTISAKLDCTNRTQAVAKAMRERLIA